MLLAASLMLDEGLHEPSAAATLAEAVAGAVANGACTPDMVASGVASTTREFMDACCRASTRVTTSSSPASVPGWHKMIGSDAILRSLEAEGWT